MGNLKNIDLPLRQIEFSNILFCDDSKSCIKKYYIFKNYHIITRGKGAKGQVSKDNLIKGNICVSCTRVCVSSKRFCKQLIIASLSHSSEIRYIGNPIPEDVHLKANFFQLWIFKRGLHKDWMAEKWFFSSYKGLPLLQVT